MPIMSETTIRKDVGIGVEKELPTGIRKEIGEDGMEVFLHRQSFSDAKEYTAKVVRKRLDTLARLNPKSRRISSFKTILEELTSETPEGLSEENKIMLLALVYEKYGARDALVYNGMIDMLPRDELLKRN